VNGQFGYRIERGATFPPGDVLLRLSSEDITFSHAVPLGESFNRRHHRLLHSTDNLCTLSTGIEIRPTGADLAELSFPFDGGGRSYLMLRALDESLGLELDRKNALQRPPADSCVRAHACCRSDAAGGRMICPWANAELEECANVLSNARRMAEREHLAVPAACGGP